MDELGTGDASALASLAGELTIRITPQTPRAWESAVAPHSTDMACVACHSVAPPAALAVWKVNWTRASGRWYIRVPLLGIHGADGFHADIGDGGGLLSGAQQVEIG